MKILYLSQYFYPEQFLNNSVSRALAASGHHVTVVCCVPNYPAGQFFEGYSNGKPVIECWKGVEVHRVFTIPRGRSNLQLLANYLTYPIAAAWRVARLGRAGRGDVSFVSMPSPLFQAFAGIFAKRLFGIPTVYWVQDIWPESAILSLGIKNRYVVHLLEALCGWIYRQADRVLVQSGSFHDSIARYGVPRDRIFTLPNCAPELFERAPDPDVPAHIRQLVPQGRPIVMFAGNIGESQDFETIIEAASLLPKESNLLIVVVGSGRAEARVREMVVQLGVAHRFLFLGRHPEAEMPAFFACADAMLVSLKDEPTFALTIPSKVQAYLACGKPIVAALAGAGGDVVSRSGAGIVVPPSDPQALSRAIRDIANIPDEQRRKMRRSARSYYEVNFSLAAVTLTLERHLMEAIQSTQ